MKTLGIISASKCNLKCDYCYLHKNKSYIDEDEKTLKAFLDGSFIKNIKTTLKKLKIHKEEFNALELWGGEPSLHLSKNSNFFKEVIEYFPNIESLSYSSNFTTNIQNHIELIKNLDKNLTKDFYVHIQISMDGPDWILSQTRHIKYDIIKNNLENFIKEFNNYYLEHINLSINYKATWPWRIYKEVNKDIDLVKDYLDFCVQEEKNINKIIFNKKINFNTKAMLGPMLEIPYNYTQQDGIDMATFLFTQYSYITDLREKTIELKNQPLFMPILTLGLDRVLENEQNIYFCNANKCGQMVDNLMFKWDGSLVACSNGFLDNNEENLNYLQLEDKEEYKNVLKTTRWLPQYKNNQIDLDEILKKHNTMKEFWTDYNNFHLTVLISQILELADCGLINISYKNNYNKALRHALMIAKGPASCYFYNLRKTGSAYTTDFDFIKLYCNGVLDLFEEIYYGK